MQREIPSLWEHQTEIVQKAEPFNYFALFAEPGTGKTATGITILRSIYGKYKRILPTFIFCPPVVIPNWKNEFKIWSKIDQNKIILLQGPGKKRAELINSAPKDSILITNYEALNMPEVLEAMKKFLMSDTSCLLLDESHKCKDLSAKRTKRAVELSDIADYRYILTGTPILNDMMDLFSQFRILDRGERFGKNFFTFRARFFEDRNRNMPKATYFPNWQPINGSSEEIKKIIQPVSQFVEKSKCLSLPPLVKKVVTVEMSKEQRRLYDSMKKDLVATIEQGGKEKHAVADLAITKALRLQQIVSGHLRVEGDEGESETITIKDNPRKEALKQILEDIAPYHKVLVWAVFRDNYSDIRSVCDDLGLGYVELHGEVKDKQKNVEIFTSDPRCRVLIGHPGSGGIGVNLVAASYSIFYSRGFSLEFDIQAEARNYRGGSEKHESITRIDLVTPASIDELVLISLASKQSISNSILRDNLERF